MFLAQFALASSEWGVARFTTDIIALTSLGILIALPFILTKHLLGFRNPWSEGNAITNRFE